MVMGMNKIYIGERAHSSCVGKIDSSCYNLLTPIMSVERFGTVQYIPGHQSVCRCQSSCHAAIGTADCR
jgi:hypothetical protein